MGTFYISEVRQGHNEISTRFKHGEQAGESVQDLIIAFVSGVIQPSELSTSVAAEWQGRLWTVYGNTRLYAFKEHVKQCPGAPKIKDIVHESPFEHLEEPIGRQLMFKLTSAMSTTIEGKEAYTAQDVHQ